MKGLDHEDKLKLARRHLTPEEIKHHISPFQSKWWEARKAKLAQKVFIRERNAKSLALFKKQQKEDASA